MVSGHLRGVSRWARTQAKRQQTIRRQGWGRGTEESRRKPEKQPAHVFLVFDKLRNCSASGRMYGGAGRRRGERDGR